LLVPFFAKLVGRKSATIILFIAALICTAAFYLFKSTDLMWIFVFQAVGSLVGGPISAFAVGSVRGHGRFLGMEDRQKGDGTCVLGIHYVKQTWLGGGKHDRRVRPRRDGVRRQPGSKP